VECVLNLVTDLRICWGRGMMMPSGYLKTKMVMELSLSFTVI